MVRLKRSCTGPPHPAFDSNKVRGIDPFWSGSCSEKWFPQVIPAERTVCCSPSVKNVCVQRLVKDHTKGGFWLISSHRTGLMVSTGDTTSSCEAGGNKGRLAAGHLLLLHDPKQVRHPFVMLFAWRSSTFPLSLSWRPQVHCISA